MREITIYQTIDGKIFTDKNEAIIHEKTSLKGLKEPPHKSGVYRWICKPEGKVYTGKATDLNIRFWDFIDALKGGNRYAGEKVQNAIKKYPDLNAWEYTILKIIDDKTQLTEQEKEKIKEIPIDKTLNTQSIADSPFSGRFSGSKSEIKLSSDDYKEIVAKNKALGVEHGFKFRLNWSLMNLRLGKHEISKTTIRHIPEELGNAITFSVTDSTCYKQVSDIGDRPHGYYAKIVNKGVLTSIGPYDNKEVCKKKYIEEKLKIIKGLLPKYKDVLDNDTFFVLDNLTIQEAEKLSSLK